MAREAQTYRAARRNRAKRDGVKFPWNVAVARYVPHSYRPNRRDRSEFATQRRATAQKPYATVSMMMHAVSAQMFHRPRGR